MQVSFKSPHLFALCGPTAREIQGIEAALRGRTAEANRIFAEVIKADPDREIFIVCNQTRIAFDKSTDLTRFTPLSETRRREDEAAQLAGKRAPIVERPSFPSQLPPPPLPLEVKDEFATATDLSSGLRRRTFHGNEYVELKS